MIVDSSALTEQVIADVVASAFDSAGQRCSALRILCVQEDVADRTIRMLKGAMEECRMANPEHLSTDIGPVIDREAKENIEQHIQQMRSKGKAVFQAAFENPDDQQEQTEGTYVKPTLIELDNVNELKKEIFGPVLHVVRFNRNELDALVDQINAAGYGLTLGVHTRIDETINQVVSKAKVGNLYVNRNMVGAVVGVQPFGGEGLSGTGPKAGGPLYLYRLLSERPDNAVSNTLERQDNHLPMDASARADLLSSFESFAQWVEKQNNIIEPSVIELFTRYTQAGTTRVLPGPTGERNTYTLRPRGLILCISDNEKDCLIQLAAVLSSGCQSLWPQSELHQKLFKSLPEKVRKSISLTKNWQETKEPIEGVIYHGDSDQLKDVCAAIAQRKGPIISVQGFERGETNLLIERLVHERSLSVNTAAAGGNASLMTIG